MKADLSRDSFDHAQHFSAVRLQQGRIVTDADWNEQADIMRYRAESQARDIIGVSGAPLDAAGYRIVAETNAFAVHAKDANVAWVVAEDGAMLATTNGGADWSLVDLSTAVNLRAVAAVGDSAWIVGDGGIVRKTADAGLSWAAQNAGTVQTLRGVAAADADHAWAVGDGGIVVSTGDGGVNWKLAQTGASRFYAVGFADAFHGVAVGQGGAIVTTNDGGTTWSPVASGSNAHLYTMARVGATRLWVAGQSGSILRSEDGGTSWLPCVTATTASLYAITFHDDAGKGWAVGEGGIVLHSADGGHSWQRQDAGTASTTTWRGLSVAGAEAAWAVGDRGALLRAVSGQPAISLATVPAVNLSIEPGRYYVEGTMCELEARCSFAQQADGGTGARLGPGVYLIYLDVWQRHISALEAPAIREVALGGPDTATRARTIGQVRALPLQAANPSGWSCDSQIPAWDALTTILRPRLAARAEPQLAASNVCEIAATAGYRRLENQLYRVEVHEGGANPSFKWSRENGAVAYAVLNLAVDDAAQKTTVRVAARGRDANLDLSVNDRVELIDDDAELMFRAGTMLEYVADGNDALELVLAGIPPGALGRDMSRHPLLRRWDHKPAAGSNVMPIVEGSWIDLEDGVQIRFEAGGVYRTGDYWQIPARTSTGDVEWLRDDNGDPVAREPAGVTDGFCRLALVEVAANGTVKVTSDCRQLFLPLMARGSCDVTIGRGGQFERLDMALLSTLLQASRGHLCLCLLPGIHDIDLPNVHGGMSRLCVHGCGPVTVLNAESIQLSDFDALELRDLTIKMSDGSVALAAIGELQLSGISLARSQVQAAEPLLHVKQVKRLFAVNCEAGPGVPASVVVEGIAEECHLSASRFDGPLSFYGPPGDGPSPRAVLEALQRPQPQKPLQLNARSARLHLVDCSLQLLTIAGAAAAQLVQPVKDPVTFFQTAVLQGNTFGAQSNLFACALLSLVGDSFVAESTDGSTLAGVMVAMRAAATGNIAVSGSSILHFLTREGFSEAANQVSIQQHSLA